VLPIATSDCGNEKGFTINCPNVLFKVVEDPLAGILLNKSIAYRELLNWSSNAASPTDAIEMKVLSSSALTKSVHLRSLRAEAWLILELKNHMYENHEANIGILHVAYFAVYAYKMRLS